MFYSPEIMASSNGQISDIQGNKYYVHYMKYLRSIALQLFKWEGLPDTVDERFLEMMLHYQGHCAIVMNPNMQNKIVASQGAHKGSLDIYNRPNVYECIFPNGNPSYQAKVFNFLDDKAIEVGGVVIKPDCVLVMNNDFGESTMPSLRLFADDLAHIKQVMKININNQKTPYIIKTTNKKLLSTKKFENQLDLDVARIVVDENMSPEDMTAVLTPAPFVADKLMEQLHQLWNEIMTYLGIDNNNQLKKERMITSEVEGNNEQTRASENIWLKSREEACKRINALWGLNVSVKIRTEVVEKLQEEIENGGEF